MLLFTLYTFAIDEDGSISWCHPTVRISKTKTQLLYVRWASTMYRVHLDSGANQGETPGNGESPSSQPISEPVIFSKRQALSRAVVVNSNMSRGKYLAREEPGSRLVVVLKWAVFIFCWAGCVDEKASLCFTWSAIFLNDFLFIVQAQSTSSLGFLFLCRVFSGFLHVSRDDVEDCQRLAKQCKLVDLRQALAVQAKQIDSFGKEVALLSSYFGV